MSSEARNTTLPFVQTRPYTGCNAVQHIDTFLFNTCTLHMCAKLQVPYTMLFKVSESTVKFVAFTHVFLLHVPQNEVCITVFAPLSTNPDPYITNQLPTDLPLYSITNIMSPSLHVSITLKNVSTNCIALTCEQ